VRTHPECDNCEALCCRMKPWGIRADENTPKDLLNPTGTHLKKREDGSCIALDLSTNLCTIYEHRPKNCRLVMPKDTWCEKARALK
jgi:Fe-S-cluster containining protein